MSFPKCVPNLHATGDFGVEAIACDHLQLRGNIFRIPSRSSAYVSTAPLDTPLEFENVIKIMRRSIFTVILPYYWRWAGRSTPKLPTAST